MGLKVVPAYKRFRPKHVRHEADSAFIPKLWSDKFVEKFYSVSLISQIGVKSNKKGELIKWA